jgi:hypothetical protein
MILPAETSVYLALVWARERGMMLLTDGRRTIITDKPLKGFVRICGGVK